MKKPSISTTVDEEMTSPPTPYSKKSSKVWPSVISHNYLELNYYHNWLYKTIGVTYILECAYDVEEQNILIEKLRSKELSMIKCRNIPNIFKEGYDQGKLIDRLIKVIQFAKQQVNEHRENKMQVQELLNFLNDQPTLEFVVVILIRSIALFQVQELLTERPFDFLGNQKQVLADFSINPQFKVIQLLSKVFNYTIKVSNKTFKGLDRIVTRSKPTSHLDIQKIQHRVFISVVINKQPVIKKSYKSSHEISKPIDKDLRLNIQQPKEVNEARYSQPGPKQKQRQKEKEKEKQKEKEKGKEGESESMNVSKQLPTDRVKICLSCGQQRKPEQKFCDCKKRKVTTTKTIL